MKNLATVLLLCLVGCGGADTPKPEKDTPAAACTTPESTLASGDRIKVISGKYEGLRGLVVAYNASRDKHLMVLWKAKKKRGRRIIIRYLSETSVVVKKVFDAGS